MVTEEFASRCRNLLKMDSSGRDRTDDWVLPGHARPPLIGELAQRVDEALVTARASEDAVMTVGAAALDAAEQARRAAELAERASGTALAVQARFESLTAAPAQGPGDAASGGEAPEDSLSDFSARADRLVARLRQLQRVPLGVPAASDASARPQPAH